MRLALLLVLILNILDATFTSFVVSNALAVEANPLMGAILELGIAPFVVVKLGIVVASLWVLWRYRHRTITKIGTAICLIIYMLLICYFLYNFSLL
tara:strand:+ start:1566 stop:1853 length:288 start_codon:yes stop_codon:yes gene_type:complete